MPIDKAGQTEKPATLKSKAIARFRHQPKGRVLQGIFKEQWMTRWGLRVVVICAAIFIGRVIASGQFSARLPLAVVFGFLYFVAVWKWGLPVILIPAVFLVWRPQQLVNFFYLNALLYDAPVAEVAVYGAFVVFFLQRRKEFLNALKNVPYLPLLIFFLFSALMLFAFGIAPDRRMSWLAIRWCVLAPAIGYLVIAGGFRSRKDVERIVFSFLLGSIILSIISILAYLGYIETAWWEGMPLQKDPQRLYDSFDVPLIGYMLLGGNVTVFFSSYAIPFSISLMLHKKKKLFALLVLLSNIIALIISGSRTPMIAFAVACLAIILLDRGKARLKAFGYTVIIGITVVSAFWFLNLAGILSDEILDRFFSIFPGLFSPFEYVKETGGGRYFLWRMAIPIILSHPFGTGFMESFVPAGGANVGPHSQYLFLLLGTGIPGTVAFMFFLFLCMRACFRGSRGGTSHWISVGTGGAIISFFVNAFMVHSYVVFGADIILLLLCGAGMAMINISHSPSEEHLEPSTMSAFNG